MYQKILVPVDLAHLPSMSKALQTATDLAKHYKIPVCFLSITTSAPSSVARTPEEFTQKLAAFAAEQGKQHAITTSSLVRVTHDPTSDVDDAIMKVVSEEGIDLVVMATHVPNLTDYIWPSNGGKIAQHANASVFLVR